METKEAALIFSARISKRQSFDKHLISNIVSLVEQGVPRRDFILEYGMSSRSLDTWLFQHGYRSAHRIADELRAEVELLTIFKLSATTI